jgi:GTPase SAR1 family protein
MKKLIQILILILIITTFHSCDSKKKSHTIDDLNWLLGKWKNDSADLVYRFYMKQKDSIIECSSFAIDDYGTSFILSEKNIYEIILLNKQNQIKYYIIDTIKQDTIHFASGELCNDKLILSGSNTNYFKYWQASYINDDKIIVEYEKINNKSQEKAKFKHSYTKIDNSPPPKNFNLPKE